MADWLLSKKLHKYNLDSKMKIPHNSKDKVKVTHSFLQYFYNLGSVLE